MRLISRLTMFCLLLSAFSPGIQAIAQEQQPISEEKASAQIPATVMLSESLYEEGKENKYATAAWLGYALARVNWIRDNFTLEDVEANRYALTFEEELYGREKLALIWRDFKEADPQISDPYLDALLSAYTAGFLREYVWVISAMMS